MYKRRRVLGTFLGVGVATAALPGLTPVLDDPPWELLLPGAVFLVVNQLIYSYPNAVRGPGASLAMVEILAVIGFLQDTLVWLLASWISSELGSGVHVDGFLSALLGGLVVRAVVLVCMAIGPQPTAAEQGA
ncbi:hypothetical protein [Streptomyces sp. NPDC003247]|uniref:hypothetical protein n=1 Tax=Streptomyces sp. NPDC003247 TaxID=3364677 RepID=UPI00367FAFBD